MRGRTVPPRGMLPPWLMGADDGRDSLIETLKADSDVIGFWDGRIGVTTVSSEADTWSAYYTDLASVPDIRARDSGRRPAYDGQFLTTNGTNDWLTSDDDSALDLLSQGGSVMMIGRLLGTAGVIIELRHTSAGVRWFVQPSGGGGQTAVSINSVSVSTAVEVPHESVFCIATYLDNSTSDFGIEIPDATASDGNIGAAILAADTHFNIGATDGFGSFGSVAVGSVLLLPEPFTAAQLAAYLAFGVAQFGADPA